MTSPKNKASDQTAVKKKRGLSKSSDSFLDTLRDVYYDKFRTTSDNNKSKQSYLAEVLRIENSSGWLDLFSPNIIRLRARVRSGSGIHDHLPVPKDAEDHARINLYPVFEVPKDDLGGKTPLIGDTITVAFKNREFISQEYGNGVILGILPIDKVAGLEANDYGQSPGSPSENFIKAQKLLECISENKARTRALSGRAIRGSNKDLTISENHPRLLNSPTDDPGIPGDLRLPEEAPSSAVPNSSAPPDPADPAQNPNSAGPGPYSASPGTNESQTNSNVDCSKIYTMSDFGVNTAATFSENGDVFNEGPIPKTWDRYTNRRIKKLHPVARKIVAEFINAAEELGYKLRITETYRTIQRQDELYAKGRPNGSIVTNARGNPKSSKHQFGIAFDCVENDYPSRGKSGFDENYPMSRWQEIGKIGKSFGFIWGGNFRKLFDGPHFEILTTSTKDMRRKEKAGETIRDPKLPASYIYPRLS